MPPVAEAPLEIDQRIEENEENGNGERYIYIF